MLNLITCFNLEKSVFMATRKDGCDTCKRLLDVASQVFAERGYKATTIAHICKIAKANVAAVNYHFGSKDGLYGQVWQQAFDKSMEAYPLDGGLPEEAPAEEKLEALIRSHLHRVLGRGAQGEAGQILLMEMTDPTEAIQDVFVEKLRPVVQRTHGIIRELLGIGATEMQIHFCAMSVVHQCLALSHRRSKHVKHPFLLEVSDMDVFIEQLAVHITAFSLAGIAGIREKIAKQAKE